MKIYLTTKKKNVLSYLVRWFIKSEISHVGLSDDDLPIILHASLMGVQFSCLKNFIEKNDIIYVYKLIDVNKEPFINILKKLDTPFDFFAIIGFIPVIFMEKVFKKKIKNPFGSRKLLFCSEVIYLYFKECIKYKFLPDNFLDGYYRETFSPQNILQLINKYPDYFLDISPKTLF